MHTQTHESGHGHASETQPVDKELATLRAKLAEAITQENNAKIIAIKERLAAYYKQADIDFDDPIVGAKPLDEKDLSN